MKQRNSDLCIGDEYQQVSSMLQRSTAPVLIAPVLIVPGDNGAQQVVTGVIRCNAVCMLISSWSLLVVRLG